MALPHIAKAFLEVQDNGLLDDQDMDALIDNITGAGLDTIASLVDWSITLFAVHTSIQKKLHEEMDRVIGRDRLPNHGDIDSLPYLRQTMKEVIRMYAPGFLSVPHRISEDFVYRNIVIKEGTWIMGSRYSADHNPTIHPDPHTFRPERCQDHGKSLCADALTSQSQRASWVFGIGRRMCIRMHFAEVQLFLAFSHLICSFNIDCGKLRKCTDGVVPSHSVVD
jgi:cytochrome P450